MGIGKRFVCGLNILSAFSVIMGIHVEFQNPKYEVARDDPVDLTCTFQTKIPNSPTVVINWAADADDPLEPQISIGTFYHPANQVDISAAYKDKATMTNNVANGISVLKFSHVTMQENRVFQCTVQIPGDNNGQPSDTTQLLVLVAPSVPVCKVQGTAEYGHNINLTCRSEEGSPKPTYKWQRFDPRNNPQPFPPRTIENNGVLSLFNVSMETSGYYICTSTNKIRSATYNMTLSVMPPSMKLGATAGILGGCVAGLVVLIIVVYCCCCRRKKNTPEYEMEEPVEFLDKPPLGTENESDGKTVDHYEESREDDRKQRIGYQDDQSDMHRSQIDDRQDRYRYDDNRSRSTDRLDRYDDNRSRSSDRLDRYDDNRSRSSDRPDRYDDNRSRSSDRLDRYDDNRSRSSDRPDRYDASRNWSSDRLDRYDDSRSRSSDRLDRYDDSRGRSNGRLDRYDDSRSRSSDRLDRYEDSRSRSTDRLDRNEGSRDRYNDRQGHYDNRRDYYGDRYEDRRNHYDEQRD